MNKHKFTFFSFLPLLIFIQPCVKNLPDHKLKDNDISYFESQFTNNSFKRTINEVTQVNSLAQFSASPTSGDLPLLVTFTNLSENASTYSWDFGDGGTSIEENPVHTYLEEGAFTVSLVASNDEGADTETKVEYINVTKPLVTEAIFSANPDSGPFPLEVTFTNSSTLANNYSWDFGDGETSTEVSPIHIFKNAGDYTITLIAYGNEVSDIVTKSNYITVKWPEPKADFSATPVEGIDPLTVTFTNKSENESTYTWIFGDGLTSIEENPVHIFKKGTYSVTLQVTNPSGINSITKENLIVVNPNGVTEKFKDKLKVYPNPVGESLNIELINENFKAVEFELFDIHGKLIKMIKPNLNILIKQELSLIDLESGNYFLRIIVDNDNTVLSIIKE